MRSWAPMSGATNGPIRRPRRSSPAAPRPPSPSLPLAERPSAHNSDVPSSTFTTNADRTHYAAYLAQALPLGSGVVEPACRLVCGLRCKGPGMRWSLSGVQSVLSLRAERLSQPACWAHLSARAPHMRRPRVATLTKGGTHAG